MWSSVNTTLNPELKPLVLNQDLIRLRCSRCKGILMLGYPLLYHDMTRQLMISLNPEPQSHMRVPAFMGKYWLRVVRSPSHLVEKIVLFDAELADTVIEAMKCCICNELLANYAAVLGKFNALPLNPSGLLFVGKMQTEGKERFFFLFLLPAQRKETESVDQADVTDMPVFVQVDATKYSEVRNYLEDLPQAGAPCGEWLTIDFNWANARLPEEFVPLGIEVVIAPDFLRLLPAAASLWAKHVELLSTKRRSTKT